MLSLRRLRRLPQFLFQTKLQTQGEERDRCPNPEWKRRELCPLPDPRKGCSDRLVCLIRRLFMFLVHVYVCASNVTLACVWEKLDSLRTDFPPSIMKTAFERYVRPVAFILYVIVLLVAIPLSIVYLVEKHSQAHVIAWFVAGIFVLATIPISLWDISLHLAHYTQPDLQRYYVRYGYDLEMGMRDPKNPVIFVDLISTSMHYVMYDTCRGVRKSTNTDFSLSYWHFAHKSRTQSQCTR